MKHLFLVLMSFVVWTGCFSTPFFAAENAGIVFQDYEDEVPNHLRCRVLYDDLTENGILSYPAIRAGLKTDGNKTDLRMNAVLCLQCAPDYTEGLRGIHLEMTANNGLILSEGESLVDPVNLECGEVMTLPFSVAYEDVQDAENRDDIIPSLDIVIKTENDGDYSYHAEFDVTPKARAVCIYFDEYGKNSAEDFAELWQDSYYDKKVVETRIYGLDWSLATIREDMQKLSGKPDDNDITYIYLATHGGGEGNSQFYCSGNWDIMNFREFFEALKQYHGRFVIMMDTCFSGNAVNTASGSQPLNGFDTAQVPADRFFVMSSTDQKSNAVFGFFSLWVDFCVSRLRKDNDLLSCGMVFDELTTSLHRNDINDALDYVVDRMKRMNPDYEGSSLANTLKSLIKGTITDSHSYGDRDMPMFCFDREASVTDYRPLALISESYERISIGPVASASFGKYGGTLYSLHDFEMPDGTVIKKVPLVIPEGTTFTEFAFYRNKVFCFCYTSETDLFWNSVYEDIYVMNPDGSSQKTLCRWDFELGDIPMSPEFMIMGDTLYCYSYYENRGAPSSMWYEIDLEEGTVSESDPPEIVKTALWVWRKNLFLDGKRFYPEITWDNSFSSVIMMEDVDGELYTVLEVPEGYVHLQGVMYGNAPGEIDLYYKVETEEGDQFFRHTYNIP